MNIRKTVRAAALLGVGLGVGSVMAAQNLIVNGDFGDEKKFAAECRSNGNPTGKLTLFTEDLTWNKCGLLEIVELSKGDKTNDIISAHAWIGCNAENKLPGFFVKPNTTYEFTIDLRGTPKYARVGARTWSCDDLWVGAEDRLTTVSFTKIGADWQTYRGTFKTGPKDVRAALYVSMWSDTQYPKAYQYKLGDKVWFDNVSVRDRQGDIEAFAKKYGKTVAVAPVSISTDMRIPFVPDELMNPPEKISVKMAVNEIRTVPIAVANLYGEMQEYRVTLEQKTPPDGYNKWDGFFGLTGFPSENITVRKAVRAKDQDIYPGKLRLDALVTMDQASTMVIPSMEGGLVTIDFDAKGVKPGKYEGVFRVIPLSETASTRKTGSGYGDIGYVGPMRDVPFELEVLPIELDREPSIPGGFYGLAQDQGMFREMARMGTREFMISPWAFMFGRDKDGNINPNEWRKAAWLGADVPAVVADHLAWAKAEGVKIRFMIAYSSYDTCARLYNVPADSPEARRIWPQWISAVRSFMAKQGLSAADWSIEVFDEPPAKRYDEVLWALKTAYETAPDVDQLVTFLGGNDPMDVKQLTALEPFLTSYIYHDGPHLRNPGYHDYIAHLRTTGKRVGHYTCSTRTNEDIDREYRQNPWVGERWNLSANHMYQIIDMQGGPGMKNWKLINGGALLYRAYGNTVVSTRSLAIRQGVEDVKYAALLRKLAKGDAETEAFLKKAAERVVSNPAGGDRYLADRVRDEIAARILRALEKHR